MKFFRPVRILKSILITFAVLFFLGSCEQLVKAPSIPGASSGSAKSILAPTGITASDGLKRKIKLEWTVVGNAKYYDIYYSESPTSDFSRVATGVVKTFYDDVVSAGKTGYYKIKAVKADGTESDFSSVVKGTSLAAPLISGGEIQDNKVTIYWYMENARDIKSGIDNYESSLVYVVTYRNESTGVTFEKILPGNRDSYTFENLDNNSKYQYSVSAYILNYQTDVESSAFVTIETLKSYIPVPPEFTATEGTLSDGIRLVITLPKKVQVQTTTSDSTTEKVDEDYPLCFEISRKLEYESENSYKTVVEKLYYNGTKTVPSDYSAYNAGDTITWIDNDVNLDGGIKYNYRIKSYVDVDYSDKIGSDYKTTTGSKSGTERVGWKFAPPKFDTGKIERVQDNGEYALVSVPFELVWNDSIDEPSNYKYVIEQTRTTFNNGSVHGDGGKDDLLFDTIEEITEYKQVFNLKENPQDKIGEYDYKLYVIPAANINDADHGLASALASVEARSTVIVSQETSAPDADLDLIDGYTNKVHLKFAAQDGVTYSIERTTLDRNGKEIGTPVTIDNSELQSHIKDGYCDYDDTGVAGGSYYSYVLKAVGSGAPSFSTSVAAETLGTVAPKFEFEKLSYNSVTVSFYGVAAAERYTVTIGTAIDKFGGSEQIVFDKKGNIINTLNKANSTMSAKISVAGNHYTVEITKPFGYDDALLSGTPANLTVKAESANAENDALRNTTSEPVPVNVIGPSSIALKADSNITKDSISISWKAVDNAKGYAIWRTRPEYGQEDSKTYKKEAAKTDVYYIRINGDNSNATILQDGNSVDAKSATINYDSDGWFNFTDKQNYSDSNPNQGKISWGLVFNYIVIPLLSEDDAVDRDEFESNFVKYKNLKDVNGYTYGYGLNLKASKADYADKIKVTWTIPEYGKDNTKWPTLYYRATSDNTSSWHLVARIDPENKCCRNSEGNKIEKMSYSSKEDGTATCIVDYDTIIGFSPSYSINRMNFAVLYETYSSSEYNFENSYVTYLSDTKENDDYKEAENTGYLFTLLDLTPIQPASDADDSTFGETIRWRLYTAQGDRKRGPGDGMNGENPYTLYVKNLNNSADWKPVATYDANGNISAVSSSWYDVSWYDVNLTDTTEGHEKKLKITPKVIGTKTKRMTRDSDSGTKDAYAGTHNGLLKVQRDYKHYYKIEAKRVNADGDLIAVNIGDDMTKYTYRKITDDEFVKGITLIVADALYQTGIPGASTDRHHDTFYLDVATNKIAWGTENKDYKHNFPATALIGSNSSFASPWTISMPQSSESKSQYGASGTGGYLYSLAWNTITVKHETGLSSYQGTIWLHAGKSHGKPNTWFKPDNTKFDLSIQYSHSGTEDTNKIVINGINSDATYNTSYDTSYTVSNDEKKFLEWLPYKLFENRKDAVSAVYTSLPTYQGTWWQAQ